SCQAPPLSKVIERAVPVPVRPPPLEKKSTVSAVVGAAVAGFTVPEVRSLQFDTAEKSLPFWPFQIRMRVSAAELVTGLVNVTSGPDRWAALPRGSVTAVPAGRSTAVTVSEAIGVSAGPMV